MVTWCVLLAALVHYVLMLFNRLPVPLGAEQENADSLLIAVYVGLSAAAAIAAGFAGVVIVFGLTSQSPVFVRFRQKAGARMRGNWISIISSAFSAAGLGLGAAVAAIAGWSSAGIVMCELGAALLIHSAIRTVWVLLVMIDLVEIDDLAQERASNTVDPASIIGYR